MTYKILVMGLPGSGKTTFSQELVKKLMLTNTVKWFNADAVRKEHNDWDFSDAGRLRQVLRMTHMADESDTDYVVCDFVCPTYYYRQVFDADCVVWLDTIKEGRFEDTNKLFQEPDNADYVIADWSQTDSVISQIVDAHKITKESHKRSFLKAVSWRTLGTIDTIVLSWIITGSANVAIAIGGVELITKTALYYLHERAWTKVKIR